VGDVIAHQALTFDAVDAPLGGLVGVPDPHSDPIGDLDLGMISSEAVRELGLEAGMLAVASVKSTDVVIETPKVRSALPPQLNHHMSAPAT
jgi:hypothetical protein